MVCGCVCPATGDLSRRYSLPSPHPNRPQQTIATLLRYIVGKMMNGWMKEGIVNRNIFNLELDKTHQKYCHFLE